MIEKLNQLPSTLPQNTATVRMGVALACYPEDALCYCQRESGALAVLLDGHLTVFAAQPPDEEWRLFLNFLPATDLFAARETFEQLHLPPDRTFTELACTATARAVPVGDALNSRDIYELLSAVGLPLPEYGDFAVDFCRKKNRGLAAAYGLYGRGAAVCQIYENTAVLTGVASLQKGCGTAVLRGLAAMQAGKRLCACCEVQTVPFYEKNGFSVIGTVGERKKRNGFF